MFALLVRLSALVCLLCVPLPAAEYFVSTSGSDAAAGTETAPWRTVSHACRTAPSGARILVAAGVYGDGAQVEGIEVAGGKQLELVGAGAGRTVIRAHAGFAPVIPYRSGTRTWTAVLLAHGAGTRVDLRGMTLDAMHLSGPALLSCAVYSDGAGGTLEGVELRGAGAIVPNGTQGRLAFVGVGKSTSVPATLRLERCQIHGWNKTGVLLGGQGLTATLRDCEVRGHGVLGTGAAAQNAVEIEEGVRFELTGNTFRDCWYEPSSFTATGLLVYDPLGSVLVEDNDFVHCKTGLYFFGPRATTARVAGNRFGNCGWAISVDTSGLSVQGNDIDAHYGVYARGLALVAIDKNRYSDWRTNPGYPSRYVTGGNTANQDQNAAELAPGFGAATGIAQPKGSGPNDLVAGDLDGDGFVDFATAQQLQGAVRIHFGAGGTNFAQRPPRDVPVPGGPVRLVTGEFSGFAGLDLAVLSADGTVRVLSNLGNTGNFNVGPAFDVDGEGDAGRASSLAAGQLDRAHEDDLVVGLAGDGLQRDGEALVLLVRRAVITPGSALPGAVRSIQDVQVGDVDGDSHADVVAVDTANLNGAADVVRIWRQSATPGSFVAAAPFALAPDGRAAFLRDLDGDGRADLLACCGGDPGRLFVGLAQSTGACVPADGSPWLVGADASALHVADLQGDSGPLGRRLDVLVVHPALERLSLFGIAPDGTLRSATGLVSELGPTRVATAALDLDGLADLLVLEKIDGEVDVRLSQSLAFTQNYGEGCPGLWTALVPQLHGAGVPARPVLGRAGFEMRVTHGAPNSVAAFALGSTILAGTGACQGYVDLLFWVPAAATDAEGRASLPLGTIPSDPGLLGVQFFAQAFVYDLQGQLGGLFSASGGLRLRLGR